MKTRTIATQTHGRYLIEIPEHSRATLIGFHGYQENAAITFEILRQIAHDRSIGVISIQGLHRFYTRANSYTPATGVVASWMTNEDRELAIADNIAYVAKVITAVAADEGITRPLIYAGFSQGVAMAYRAAVFAQRPCDGVIALAGDVPPDVVPMAASLPKVLIGRGTEDRWYTAEKAAADLTALKSGGATAIEHVFEGGHVWDAGFITRAGQFIDELLNT